MKIATPVVISSKLHDSDLFSSLDTKLVSVLASILFEEKLTKTNYILIDKSKNFKISETSFLDFRDSLQIKLYMINS